MGEILDTIGYRMGYHNGTEYIPPVATNGYFKLTITDIDGIVTVIDHFIPTSAFYWDGYEYSANELCVFRLV